MTIFKTARDSGGDLSDAARSAIDSAFDGTKLTVAGAKSALKVLATSSHAGDQRLHSVCNTHITKSTFDGKRSLKSKGATMVQSVEDEVKRALHTTARGPNKVGKASGNTAKKRMNTDLLKSLLQKMVNASTRIDEIETAPVRVP